ncbi:MAG: DUF2383 domain-containing protein [Gammaproteobacteria bacterium]
MNHRKINHLLNTELSAVETYEQALQDKEWKVLSPDPQIQALFHILVDHLQAVSQLGTEVQRLGGTPVNDTQTRAWDSWSHRRMDAARLFGDVNRFGDKAALEVLKEGEETGLKEYQAVLHHRALSPEVKSLIKSLKTKQQAHVRALDNLMSRPGVSIPLGG